MVKKAKKVKTLKRKDFTKEYNKIIDTTSNSVVVEAEWTKEGDYFQKLSMFDNNYTLIPTLGSTTLIST